MKRRYGSPPVPMGAFRRDLQEVMYYLYLPVKMAGDTGLLLPENVAMCRPMIEAAFDHAISRGDHHMTDYYVYLSARKGWATPDNPLNRPGWHCDGFGTDDRNYVWWRGPGTRFALQEFEHIAALSVQQEPVAWRTTSGAICTDKRYACEFDTPLYAAPLAQPAGMQLVPIEPTELMLLALEWEPYEVIEGESWRDYQRRSWAAVLAAAPVEGQRTGLSRLQAVLNAYQRDCASSLDVINAALAACAAPVAPRVEQPPTLEDEARTQSGKDLDLGCEAALLWKTRAEAAERALAEARRDALRYRWLRERCLYHEHWLATGGYLHGDEAEELDYFIDAALAGQGERDA